MGDLQSLAQGYMSSLGYNILERTESLLVADKMDIGGGRDTRLIWAPQRPEHEKDFRQLEWRLLEDFESTISRYPDARRFLVLESLGGFSQDFWKKADEFGIEQRVAIHFFDTPFKSEEAPKEFKSAIKDLLDPSITWKRIPQPYSLLVEGEPGGEDLFEHLFEELRWPPESPCLRIIVGPAGIGKTFLFKTLFYNLYDHFQSRKRQQELFPRPIPLIPAYLPSAPMRRTQTLINNFIDTEIAKPIRRPTFEWMLVHGFLLWLFDGLDELYAGDPNFFEEILDLLTREDSKAQILIFARDSLITSCEAFAQFLDEFRQEREAIRLYRLEDWGNPSKRKFAYRYLEEPDASRFFNLITQPSPLKSLSSKPYYCDLLMHEYKQGNPVSDITNDLALLKYVISKIIEREEKKHEKRFFQERLQPGGLYDWLETLAVEFYEGEFKSFTKEKVEVYAKLVLSEGLTKGEQKDTIITLLRFPLFISGPEPGTLAFEHELISEYLAGHYLAKQIKTYPARVGKKLGTRVDLADSLIARSIASNIAQQEGGLQALIKVLKTGLLSGRAFANLLQLLLLATPARDIIKSSKISVEGQDLRCVKFVRRDLQGVSFRNCDLTNATFRDCDLRDTQFEGACLSGTRFERISKEELEGARFGNLERFHSIYVGKRRIDDFQKALEWIQEMTGQGKEIKTPCPAALQLKALFRKFVYSDGSPRCDKLGERALIRGKRYPGAPTPEECIEECLRFGYLHGPDYRNRIGRARGDRYSDMVEFVTHWGLSPELRRLLDSLCSIDGCEHVPTSAGSRRKL